MRDGAIVEALKRTSLPQCGPRCPNSALALPVLIQIKEPVQFLLEDLIEHRRHKISSWKHLRNTRLLVILSSPLIYLCVLPFLMVDASVALYQLVCFPIYGIPKVPRKDYLVFDRGLLAYLNTIEKVGCIYCSYANGLLALITEIASRTEQHFCPIKHAHRLAKTPSRYGKYLPYGDARAYRGKAEAVAQDYSDIPPETK
jgi:hypothetical protein